MIIIVFGLPGSGKSFFAERLAGMINAEYVNSDRLRKEIFEERTYTTQEKAIVYDIMLKKMKDAISQKRNMVMDATFYTNALRQLFTDADKEKGNINFIEVKADEGLIRERLKTERPDSEADFAVYKLIKQQWEPINEPHLSLESTNSNINDMLRRAIQYLEK